MTVGSDSRTLRVAGVVNDYTAGGLMVYIDRATAEKKFGVTGVDAYLISTVHPTPPALAEKLTELADRDGLLLHSFTQIRERVDGMVSGVVGGLWVLLALGLLVGALGVVNTLTMNVLEQTQELGMLRAIGMPRRQLMRTVLAQAVLIGLLGIGAGAVSGFLLAATINLSLASLFGHSVQFALRADLVALLLAGALAIVLVGGLGPRLASCPVEPDRGHAGRMSVARMRLPMRAVLQSRRRGLDRVANARNALHFQLPPVDPFAARDDERVEMLAAEAEPRRLAGGHRQDEVDPARLIANLDPHVRGDVEPATAIDWRCRQRRRCRPFPEHEENGIAARFANEPSGWIWKL